MVFEPFAEITVHTLVPSVQAHQFASTQADVYVTSVLYVAVVPDMVYFLMTPSEEVEI